MENQKYSMYEIITMTPGMAGKVLFDEINKYNPDIELIKNLIHHSWIEDINIKSNHGFGLNVLMWASIEGNTEIVRLLLERPEIDVNMQDKYGYTALIWASRYGREEIVKLLLERPEIDVNVQDKYGYTALMWASQALTDGAGNVDTKINGYLYRNRPIAFRKT